MPGEVRRSDAPSAARPRPLLRWAAPLAAFLLAGLAGALLTPLGEDDAGAAAAGRATVEARAADPWGVPPEAGAVGERQDEYAAAPPWGVLVWREGRRTCFEPGQVVDRHTPGRSDELPGIKARGVLHRATLVGALRYDSKSGIGIQLYGIGRFAPYPREIGGSCGDPDEGAGLLLSWETRTPRQDAAKAVTVVSGVAGPRVRAISAGGRNLPLSRRRAFVHAVRGVSEPAAVPVTVTYADGSRRRFPAR
jgi:hypothetical protein